MDDRQIFRNAMAEKGIEYTPTEAETVMDAAIEFRNEMDMKALEDPDFFDNLAEMTHEDKIRICQEFADDGTEMTVDELDEIVQLMLSTQEDDEVDDWWK